MDVLGDRDDTCRELLRRKLRLKCIGNGTRGSLDVWCEEQDVLEVLLLKSAIEVEWHKFGVLRVEVFAAQGSPFNNMDVCDSYSQGCTASKGLSESGLALDNTKSNILCQLQR